jgi:hypothetical protein
MELFRLLNTPILLFGLCKNVEISLSYNGFNFGTCIWQGAQPPGAVAACQQCGYLMATCTLHPPSTALVFHSNLGVLLQHLGSNSLSGTKFS